MNKRRFGLALLALLLAAAPAAAAQIVGGERVVIAAGEVKDDDVIVGARTFVLAGTIRGDLVVFGGTVTIAPGGVVEGDLIAAGRSIEVQGRVRDDARIAGAVLLLGERAAVGDDLIAAGQSLETRPGSSVGGELLYGGGQALLAGAVAEGARIGTGGLELRGSIRGDVEAAVGEPGAAPPFSPAAFLPELPPMPQVAPGLTVREGARIGGDLRYTGAQDATLPAGAVAGKVTRRPAEPASAPPSAGERFLDTLRTLGALLVVGLLLAWAAPATMKGSASVLRSRPGASLGWGAVSLFAVVFGLLALAMATALAAVALGLLSLGGLLALAILGGIVALAAFVLAFVVVAVYVSKVVVAYLGGRLLLARLKPEWAEQRVAPLLVGVLLLVLLGALPVAGGLIHLLAALAGLGALWLLARERLRARPERRAASGPAPPPEEALRPAA